MMAGQDRSRSARFSAANRKNFLSASIPISKFPDNLVTLVPKMNDWFGLVAHVISPSEFYFHVACPDNEKIDEFHHKLNKFYNNSTVWFFKHKWKVREEVGNFCVCYFSGDSPTALNRGWYRAQVLDWNPNSRTSVSMQLVDYGNKFEGTFPDIRPLVKEFAEHPLFATRCHLSYLRPPLSCKEWPSATSVILQKHLKHESMEKVYMISPTGKEETPPYSSLHDSILNHEKSVPVILLPEDNSGAVNDYLIDIEFAEFDPQMVDSQSEAKYDDGNLIDIEFAEFDPQMVGSQSEAKYDDGVLVKEMEESRRKVEEWCTKEKGAVKPSRSRRSRRSRRARRSRQSRPAREPSPDFRVGAFIPEVKAKPPPPPPPPPAPAPPPPPPPDEMDEWNPMMEDYEDAEKNDEDPCVAVTGYAPTDEMRICRFFAADGKCPWGTKCRREHVLSNIHWITTDKEAVFASAFNELPMYVNGQSLVLNLTAVNGRFFYAVDSAYASDLEILSNIINAPANLAAYKRLRVRPALGQIVLAKFCDDRFYRARVIEGADGSEEVVVWYVDFGHSESVPEKALREIEPQFLHLAFQSIQCSLSNIELFQEMYDKADKFLSSESKNVLKVKVICSDASILHVLATDEDENDVGEALVNLGCGTLVDVANIIRFKRKQGNIMPG